MPYEQVGKNEPVCIADEVPFEIPDSWEWVKLGDVGLTNIGLTYKPSDKVDSGGMPVLRSNNIQNGKIDLNDIVYVSCDVPERAMIEQGDILICARNGSRMDIFSSVSKAKSNSNPCIIVRQTKYLLFYLLCKLTQTWIITIPPIIFV